MMKIVLKFQDFAAKILVFNKFYRKLLKAKLLDIYQNKSYIEYYIFFSNVNKICY